MQNDIVDRERLQWIFSSMVQIIGGMKNKAIPVPMAIERLETEIKAARKVVGTELADDVAELEQARAAVKPPPEVEEPAPAMNIPPANAPSVRSSPPKKTKGPDSTTKDYGDSHGIEG